MTNETNFMKDIYSTANELNSLQKEVNVKKKEIEEKVLPRIYRLQKVGLSVVQKPVNNSIAHSEVRKTLHDYSWIFDSLSFDGISATGQIVVTGKYFENGKKIEKTYSLSPRVLSYSDRDFAKIIRHIIREKKNYIKLENKRILESKIAENNRKLKELETTRKELELQLESLKRNI